MRKYSPHRANICFDCQKACGGCSWSALDENGEPKFEPVPGWTAEETIVLGGYYSNGEAKHFPSYHITECPEFVRDEPRTGTDREMQDSAFAWLMAKWRREGF